MPAMGIGWRHPHYAALLEQQPALGFIEVHSENFFAPGGASRAVLRDARATNNFSLDRYELMRSVQKDAQPATSGAVKARAGRRTRQSSRPSAIAINWLLCVTTAAV
mgnify:CR=1 FL=1